MRVARTCITYGELHDVEEQKGSGLRGLRDSTSSCSACCVVSVAFPSLLAHADISWTGPRSGSIAGGTVLTVAGSGFSTDAYSTSNLVWLQGEDGTKIVCDFIRCCFLSVHVICMGRFP